MKRNTSSHRSVIENLENRQLFSAFAGVDLNNDGTVTGDDFVVIDASGDVTSPQATVGYKLIERAISTTENGTGTANRPVGGRDTTTLSRSVSGADFNGDNLVTGDDYTVLDADPYSKESTQGYRLLNRVLA